MLRGKNILLGITAGIAAYKICFLVRKLKQAGANVKIVATPNSLNFVTKLTLQNLSQNQVFVDEFDVKNWKPEHISLADESDIMVIAPSTANTIGKIANGIADNLLTSIVCAFDKKIIIAPAMNCKMWRNQKVQENISVLKKRGMEILDPEKGFLACGYSGNGRLCSIDKIFDSICENVELAKLFENKKITITCGGTIEEIDSVRYISNYSSGKMGLALANCVYKMGAKVVLISTKDFDTPFELIKVKSALEMQDAVNKEFETSDYIIMAAAVADFRPKNVSKQKIKKNASDTMTLELVKNPDILKNLVQKRETSDKKPLLIGFCAETNDLIENATEKITKKGCDYLIANDVSRTDIGFNSDNNEVVILNKCGILKQIPKTSKNNIAKEILQTIASAEKVE